MEVNYRFLFFFLIFLSVLGFGQETFSLSLEERVVLQEFFRTLTEESEAGYVFFKKKPVCIHGYSCKDSFAVGFPLHRQAVALREGARIWKKISNEPSDILIHIYDTEDPLVPGYRHIAVIHVPLFHQTVNRNLPLFQYVLGPSVTSDKLLEALISPGQAFHSVLKGDKVLIGETLGFGVQNALYISRLEEIQEALEKDTPPFKQAEKLVKEFAHEFLPFEPSFGFKSFKQEVSTLEDQVEVASEKLLQKSPEFIFGCLKKSKASKAFILELERTQDKIQKFLSSPKFLAEMIETTTGGHCRLPPKEAFAFSFDQEEASKAIAKGLWESIFEYDPEYRCYFIEGFENSTQNYPKADRAAWFPGYRREFIQAKENLKLAHETFQSLAANNDLRCVAAHELYYRIIKEGKGEIECSGALVKLEYSIFSPLGHCLAHNRKATINLKNTIPGFAQGIQGMKIGETREIFIHPNLAYGFKTTLDKCIHLRAVVTLLDIDKNGGFDFPLESCHLSPLMDSKNQLVINENYKMALLERGSKIARHLKKCPEVDLILIANHLKHLHTKNETVFTSEEEQDLINKIHWNIYFGRS